MEEAQKHSLEVAVLIPARNEELNLRTCVESLTAQSEDGFRLGLHWKIWVIDDHSTDNTLRIARELAAEHEGVVVLQAPEWKRERHGFTGKNAALWHGAQQDEVKSAEWILFTDADTIHKPESLHRAVVEAERHQLSMLSYSPQQITTGLLQRAIMPLVFSELASVYPPKKINDPSSPVAAANGQFLLVKREPYFEIGGHRAVADQVLEDVALARKMKRRHAIRLRYAPEAVSARMYRSFGEMWTGWTKNLALLFGNPMFLAANRMLDFLLLLGLPAMALLIPFLITWQKAALWILWLRVIWRYYNRISRSNFPVGELVLSVIGLPVFAVMLVRSWQRVTLLKTVEWKGREYRT
ncbi:MAG: glycosyltransferase [Acidobacteria bacterium]|nr:glycosyltransferase [Acidobacteriota bacterium]